MSSFVLDTTVTMAWCFADEATPLSEVILDRLSNLATFNQSDTKNAQKPGLIPWAFVFAAPVSCVAHPCRMGRVKGGHSAEGHRCSFAVFFEPFVEFHSVRK